MSALIPINQLDGRPIVSARQLYGFLGIRSPFVDWFKTRTARYGLVGGQDYSPVVNSDAPPGDSQPELDYALTLGCAKELAMVEGNARGKQARQYFIDCEQRQDDWREATAQVLLGQAKLLVDQAQQLTEQSQRLSQLEDVLHRITHRDTPRPVLPFPEPPSEDRSPLTGQHLTELVEAYCRRQNVSRKDTWNWLFRRLYELYRINVLGYLRPPGASLLEVAEKFGHLGKLYGILKAELNEDQYP